MRIVLLGFLVLSMLVACRPPSGTSSSSNGDSASPIRLELSEDPKMGNLPLNVFLLDGSQGVTGAEVEITGDMTHAGMIPVIVSAQEVEAGLYRADDFEFTMAGDWIITTEVTLPDGKKLMEEIKVTVPGQ